ncbi:hypothetical protein ACVJGD_006457 [Bradyrhizobium sp. USDA 10063]
MNDTFPIGGGRRGPRANRMLAQSVGDGNRMQPVIDNNAVKQLAKGKLHHRNVTDL